MTAIDYNDGYRPIFGQKHPAALGRPFARIWMEAGADDYLIKPFSARELLARVGAHLQMAQLRREATAALRESEKRFRNMADTAPAMLWITEPDASCSFLSLGWYQYTGQTEERALGLGWLDAVHPEDRAQARRIYLAANEKREAFALDYRLCRADGEYRWAIDSGRPRFDEAGTFLGYIGSVVDVHERKTAEETLQCSHAELRRHADELVRFNRVAVGHEVRMIELKQEINELCQRQGQPPCYSLDFEQGAKAKHD